MVEKENAKLRVLKQTSPGAPGEICLSRKQSMWYHTHMTAKLTKELADAVDASDQGVIDAIGPDGGKAYAVVERERYRQMVAAARKQKDYEAIAEGIRQMEAGQTRPLDESFEAMRQKLGFPEQK